jgi:hypothetical protein
LSNSLLEQAVLQSAETGQPQRQFLPAEYQADSWPAARTIVIKAAAEVVTRARRVIVRLSASWPHLEELLRVGRAILRIAPLMPGTG